MNNKDIAKLLGRATYSGSPCRLGHTMRLTKNARCEECEAMQALLPATDRVTSRPKKERTEHTKEYHRRYRAKNKETIDACTRQWVEDNREMRREYQREYRLRNMDKPYYKSRAKTEMGKARNARAARLKARHEEDDE